MTDNILLELLHNEPSKGLEILMDDYMGLVYTITYNKLSAVCSREDIEECVSDIFYEFYEARESIDLERGSIKAFLSVFAKRKAIDLFRAKSKKSGKVISIEGEELENVLESSETVEGFVAKEEEKSELIKAIKALGEPDSEIMVRKYYFGQTSKEIALIFGLKDNTVDKKVSRSLVKLQKSLGGAFCG